MSKRKSLRDVGALPMQWRELGMEIVPVARDANAPADSPDEFDVTFSSDSEVERWFGIEVLDHNDGAIDMTRASMGLPVLEEHGGSQLGVVHDIGKRFVGGLTKLGGRMRLSRSATAISQDVKDKIRTTTSVGYWIKKAKMTEQRGDVEVWHATRWQPAEVSFAAVPADVNVGIGRADDQALRHPVEIEEDEMFQRSMKLNDAPAGGGPAKTEEPKPAAAAARAADAGKTTEQLMSEERERQREIRAMAANNGIKPDRTARWLDEGATVATVAQEIVKEVRSPSTRQPASEHLHDDLPEYSYTRAIQRQLAQMEGTGKFDGLEAEVDAEIRKALPDFIKQRGGFFVPHRTRPRNADPEKRTLTSITATKGTETVFETPGELIEVLRARALVLARGARLLTGLTGPVGFPRQTGVMTVNWTPENPASDVAESDIPFGLALLSPRTLMGAASYTRQLLQQSSVDVEAMTREELGIAHGLAIDRGFLHGAGVNGEPVGVYKQINVNVNDFSSAPPDLGGVMALISAVADKNADMGALGFLTTPLLAAKMRTTLEFSGVAPASATLWQGPIRDGTLVGYGAASTTQVSKVMSSSEATGGSSHGIIYGNWNDGIVALFGAMEVVIDPYSLKKRGIIQVTTFQMADTLIRHGESFSKGINATTS